MDIYRFCSLGKALNETIQEVLKENSDQLVKKIWGFYDQSIEEEMKKISDSEATITGTLDNFQRIPLENSNDNKQVCRMVINNATINYKQQNSQGSIPIPQTFLKIVAYEQQNKIVKKKKPNK